MTPAGIERDRQIAEMRGEKQRVVCYHDNVEDDCIWEPTRTKCSAESAILCGDRVVEPHKPYSTDISCAMELAEDMKRGDLLALNLLMDAWYKWMHPDRHCDDLADAISGAWLLWQEGK